MMAALSRLTARERALLALLALAVVPAALWFMVAQPIMADREAAQDALVQAQADLAFVAERDAAFRALTPQEPPAAPVGLAGLETALARLEMRSFVRGIEETAEGRIVLRFEGIGFDVLGRFLDRLDTGLGYRVTGLRIVPQAAPGTVEARLDLAPL